MVKAVKKKLPNSVFAGATMKKLRAATGLGQKEWAELLGTEKQRIGNYEIDRYPTPRTVLILAGIAADTIARGQFFEKVKQAIKAAKAE